MNTAQEKKALEYSLVGLFTNNIYVKFKHMINHCSHIQNKGSCEIKTRFTLNEIFSDS